MKLSLKGKSEGRALVYLYSYTWRSIILEVETSKHGIIWRIGNGQQINIWSDPWLTPKGRNLLTTVEELIDPTTGQWDVQLLNQTFWEEDIQIIRAILVHAEMEYVVGWHYDSKGHFSVKSAYKAHRAAESRRQTKRKSKWSR